VGAQVLGAVGDIGGSGRQLILCDRTGVFKILQPQDDRLGQIGRAGQVRLGHVQILTSSGELLCFKCAAGCGALPEPVCLGGRGLGLAAIATNIAPCALGKFVDNIEGLARVLDQRRDLARPYTKR
jgi:hypothetical protein